MNQIQFSSKSTLFTFLYDDHSIMFASENSINEYDSAWMKITKELRSTYNIGNKMNAVTRLFDIEDVLSANLLINGNMIAKYETFLHFIDEDTYTYNQNNHLNQPNIMPAILFIRFNDIALSSYEFHIDIEHGLRIITTFDEIKKLSLGEAIKDR
jgi:hypothetical protein